MADLVSQFAGQVFGVMRGFSGARDEGVRFDSVLDRLHHRMVGSSAAARYTKTLHELGEELDYISATAAGGAVLPEFANEAAFIEAERKRVTLKRDMAAVSDAFWKGNTAPILFMLGAFTKTFFVGKQIQQNLIEANSLTEYRNKLLLDTLRTVGATGVGFDTASESARALVAYSLDTNASWTENVKTVSMMVQGLGAAAQETAQLAAIVENRLGKSFKDVGDQIATIVNNTSLNASEAVSIAKELKTRMATLGFQEQTEGVMDRISHYEDLNKQMGGTAGEITKMIAQFSTLEGIASGSLIGAPGGSDILRSVHDLDTWMLSVQRFVDRFPGDKARMLMETQISASGASAEVLTRLVDGMNQARKVNSAQIDLENRYREQMHATGEVVLLLKDQLWSMTIRGLLPVLNRLKEMASILSELTKKINESKLGQFVIEVGGTIISMGLIISAFARVLSPIKGLFKTLVSSFSRTGTLLARFGPLLARLGIGAAAGTATTAGAVAGTAVGAGAAAAGGTAIAPIAIAVVALLGIAYVVHKLYGWLVQKELKDKLAHSELMEVQKSIAHKGAIVSNAMMSGDVARIVGTLFDREDKRGMLGDVVEMLKLSNQPSSLHDALAHIDRTFLAPTHRSIQATQATLGLSTDERGPQRSEDYEKLGEVIRAAIRQGFKDNATAIRSAEEKRITLQKQAETDRALQRAADAKTSGVRRGTGGFHQ